jgi:hypothetical protein
VGRPREPAGARPGQPYVPDAGQLTRIIVRGMVRLGYQSFTAPTRVLDPHVMVTGNEVDIDTIRHFEHETKAEIMHFVEEKGTRYRWALNTEPTFSYRVDPKVGPGTLVISRAPSPGDVGAGPEPGRSLSGSSAPAPSWSAWYGPDETGPAAPPAPSATTRDPVRCPGTCRRGHPGRIGHSDQAGRAAPGWHRRRRRRRSARPRSG